MKSISSHYSLSLFVSNAVKNYSLLLCHCWVNFIFSLSITGAWANIPAAYLACEGAENKDPCALPGPQYGVCVLDTLCEDPPETAVNECMICVDECWDSEDGLSCIRPWTGEVGVCETQSQCTDKPETSFEECRRCVQLMMAGSDNPEDPEGELDNRSAEQSGCQSKTSPFSLAIYYIWGIYLFLCILLQLKRQNLTK